MAKIGIAKRDILWNMLDPEDMGDGLDNVMIPAGALVNFIDNDDVDPEGLVVEILPAWRWSVSPEWFDVYEKVTAGEQETTTAEPTKSITVYMIVELWGGTFSDVEVYTSKDVAETVFRKHVEDIIGEYDMDTWVMYLETTDEEEYYLDAKEIIV